MAATGWGSVSGSGSRVVAPTRKLGVQRVPGAKKIRLKELPVFSRMIAAMLDSGIPLVQALQALEEQTSSISFRNVIKGLRIRIEGGSELSRAMQDFPDVFDHTYVCMMRAGEAGGMLSEISGRVAKYLESSARLRSKVKSAMMYPIVVMTLALGIATAMIIWLIPVFADIYADFGSALPGPTRFLVALSGFIRHNFLIVAAGGAGLFYGLAYLKRTEQGAYAWDRAVLKFPMIGELATKISLGRVTSTFAQLIHSGVPILESLDIVAVAAGNKVYEKILLRAKNTVEGGELLSTELQKHKEFPRMLVHMLAAGERTGKMDDMLQKVSDFYEDEVQNSLSGLTAIIEPLLMVFLG
ncbi:MAG: type II secretion system F family protein, partial [Kiritimatiellia bacterium]|nr:type II secretion system F family protein [Kiritimatiellia bacterium]